MTVNVYEGEGLERRFTANLAAETKPGTLCKVDSTGKLAIAAATDWPEFLVVVDSLHGVGKTADDSLPANSTVEGITRVMGRVVKCRSAAKSGGYNAFERVKVANGGQVTAASGTDATFGYIHPDSAGSANVAADTLVSVTFD